MGEKFERFLEKWGKFIDAFSIVWIILFVSSLLGISWLKNVSLFDSYTSIAVSFADIFFNYKKVGNVKVFVKTKWLVLITAVPLFRFLRMVRVFRLIVRFGVRISLGELKVTLKAKNFKKVYKAYRKLTKVLNDLKEDE